MIKLKSLFRRGQGPSGSKHSANAANVLAAPTHQQLKASASTTSLDNIDVAQPPLPPLNTKPSKQGIKERIDQKIKGSRDKLGSRENLVDTKDSHKQRQHQQQRLLQQQQQQMPRIQQHVGNNNLLDQRDVANYVVDPLTKELTDINFDGPREVGRDCSKTLIIYVDTSQSKTHRYNPHIINSFLTVF